MSWFVWRKDHEDLKKLLEKREAELRHILDLIYSQQFGVQLFDTIASDMPAASTPDGIPAPAEPEPAPEDEMEAENQREMQRLAVLRRTSPSRLGPAMSEMMKKRLARQVQAAHPQHSKVTEVFEKARKEVS